MTNGDIVEVSENSWFAWSKHVLMQLETDSKCLHELKKEVFALKIEIQGLKKDMQYRCGVWGMIGGALPVALGLAIWAIKN